jgi:hypothetical protein
VVEGHGEEGFHGEEGGGGGELPGGRRLWEVEVVALRGVVGSI